MTSLAIAKRNGVQLVSVKTATNGMMKHAIAPKILTGVQKVKSTTEDLVGVFAIAI